MPARQDLTMVSPLHSPDGTRVGTRPLRTPNRTAFSTLKSLPQGLQGDCLVDALSNTAARQGDPNTKGRAGSPTFGGAKDAGELKFPGRSGKHRCCGNPLTGGHFVFTVYDPAGSLH